MARFTGVLGIVVLLGLAYLFSTNRRAIRLKTVAWGLGLQFVFAIAVIYWSWGQAAMSRIGDKVNNLLRDDCAGSSFVLGNLGLPAVPNVKLEFLPAAWSKWGSECAFQVLQTSIVICGLF